MNRAGAVLLCTWILWGKGVVEAPPLKPGDPIEFPSISETLRDVRLKQWQPLRGYASRAECEVAAGDRRGVAIEVTAGEDLKATERVAVFARCLPDTIDPRAARDK